MDSGKLFAVPSEGAAVEIKVLGEQEALAGIDPPALRAALRRAFAGLTTGSSVQPAQTVTVFPEGAGDCIFYPGAILDLGLVGVKVSPYLASQARAGENPVTAWTLILSAQTGQPVLLCDSYGLTTLRTAATTALAVELLAGDEAKTLAVIGAGRIAQQHLRQVLPLRPWSRTRIFAPSLVDGRRTLDDLPVTVAATAREAVEDADVVMLCTSATAPVIDAGWLAPGALVTSIATNGERAHEIDPQSLPGFQVFCDYRATAPDTAGELLIARDKGWWSPDQLAGDLPELLTGQATRPTGGRIFFRSTGLGIEDLAIASLLA
jgi:L-arginine dehydrogenase